MKLYLIRHGQSEHNVKHVIGGNGDFPLTEVGIAQAKELANRIDDVDVIFSSDLLRAKDTANIIGEKIGVKPFVYSDLNEIDFGLFEGHTFKDVKNLFPLEYETYVRDWANFTAPKGESISQVKDRLKGFYNILLNDYFDKNVAIVAHQIVIKALVEIIFKIPDLKLKVKNAGVVTIQVTEDGVTFVF